MKIELVNYNNVKRLLSKELTIAANKATMRALNDLAFVARTNTQRAIPTWLTARPSFVSLLKRTVIIDKATAQHHVAIVGFSNVTGRRTKFESGSGLRTPERSEFIAIPINGERRKPATILKRKGSFKTEKGIFSKDRSGKVTMNYTFKRTTQHRKKVTSFEKIVGTTFTRHFDSIFILHFNKEVKKFIK